MERRGFLKALGAMVAGIALEQAIPLGRVWSFPKDIRPLNIWEPPPNLTIWYDRKFVEQFNDNANGSFIDVIKPLPAYKGARIQLYAYKFHLWKPHGQRPVVGLKTCER